MQNIKTPILTLSVAILIMLISNVNAIVGDGIASCESKFENVGINAPNELPIGEVLPLITLNVTGNIPLNLEYRAVLYKNNRNPEDVITTRDGAMGDGFAEIDFGYTPLSQETLILILDVCSQPQILVPNCDANDIITEEKIMTVKRTYKANLFCPITNFVNEEITCSWEPKDVENPTTLVPLLTRSITVTQGERTFNPSIDGQVAKFTLDKTGSATVKMISTAEGFVGNEEEITIQVGTSTTTQTFEIDGKDYFSLSSQGISTGVTALSLFVKEGNSFANVREISGEIITPSGQNVPLNFIKTNDEWKANFNFEQPGQKYIFKGVIKFEDINKQDINFNYDILTLASATEGERSFITFIIIGISAVILIIIIIIIIVVMRKKK